MLLMFRCLLASLSSDHVSKVKYADTGVYTLLLNARQMIYVRTPTTPFPARSVCSSFSPVSHGIQTELSDGHGDEGMLQRGLFEDCNGTLGSAKSFEYEMIAKTTNIFGETCLSIGKTCRRRAR
jgi:hypothetical protein